MSIAYNLTQDLRKRLKEPLGILIRGAFAETISRFKTMIEEEKPPCIISVGDTVSKNLERNQVFPRISIIDNVAMRRNAKPYSLTAEKTLYIRNPPATITDEALLAVQDALKTGNRTKIVVEGEEDLLALVAILYAPENTFVVYGQPYEGIVVVKATPEKRAEVSGILRMMENARKAK